MADYTYDQYLVAWREKFGDVDQAETHYYLRGEVHPLVLNRLTREEFQRFLAVLDRLGVDYAQAIDANDLVTMGRLLRDMYPIEIALLI